jgi:rhodanese-related sulfurtransferase
VLTYFSKFLLNFTFKSQKMEDIIALELKERLKKGEKLNIIDVREEWEYAESNIGATLIPLGELSERISELESFKNEELILHCKSGARSGNAKKYLEQQGFTKVRNLLGGILGYLKEE